MNSFRTTFVIPKNQLISFNTHLLSLGSCFSENIGSKLEYYKFPININPFGILYNPESIAQSIEILIDKKEFTINDLFEENGVYNSFYHHSRLSHTDPNVCLNQINKAINEASDHLRTCKVLLITFGTAWVYELKRNNQIVSNCHKVPAKEFNRFKLSTHQIIDRYKELVGKLRSLNPELKILFTVSPVRHLKDGAAENQLSKATLIMAVHQLVKELTGASYFPSYEIMMDDLRDYRFYNEDMIHPSPVAVDYIWEKFCKAVINEDSQKLMPEIAKINQAINHRPFNPETEAHQKFLKSTMVKMEVLEKKLKINYSREKETLQKQIL